MEENKIMYKYILVHEKWIKEQLNNNDIDLNWLLKYHNRQIAWVQHERLVHLIVMLFTCLMFLLTMAVMFTFNNIGVGILFFTITILTICYILHYYRLENAVQRWYKISNKIEERIQEEKENQIMVNESV